MRWLMLSPEVAVFAVILIFVLYGATQNSQFFDGNTWINILRNAVFISIAGCGATFVLISGGLDLSVGSVFMASSVGGAFLASSGADPITSILAGVLIGATVGAVNGVLVNYAQISAIIVTLGTLFAVRALAVTLSGGAPIGPLPSEFTAIGQGSVLGLPNVIIVALVVIALFHVVLQYTAFGWNVRAIGGNPVAARSMGLPIKRISTGVYVMAGSLAGFAGVLMASRLGSGTPSLGAGFELQVIAAAIIGGTSIFGAVGTIAGTVLGALLLSVLTTGLVLLKVDPSMQNFAIGAVIVIAAGVDRLRKSRMFKTSKNADRKIAAEKGKKT
jgi:ribose/xylose/arabinose/galactoside ABC-type transport system permease subunit